MTNTTSRRAILAGAASLSALAIPAIATVAPDPIFAAIEAHETATVDLNAACKANLDDEVTSDLLIAQDKVMVDLLETSPTSLAGVAAVLRYVGAYCESDDTYLFENTNDPLNSAGAAFPSMLADALEALAVQS